MLDVMRFAQEVDRRQLLLMDGTQQALNQVDKAALTLSGGVGGAWPGDSSNWRQIRGGVWAPVAGAAVDNLITTGSFEGGTVEGWAAEGRCYVGMGAEGYHGTKSLKTTGTQASGTTRNFLDVTAVTSNDAPFTLSTWMKANNALAFSYSVYIAMAGDVSLVTLSGNPALTYNWQRRSVTKTFAGDAVRKIHSLYYAGYPVGAETLQDAIQLEAGSIQHMFALDYRNAVTIASAKPAGLGVGASSVIVSFKSCLAGNAGLARYLFDFGTMECYIDASNNLTFLVTDAAAGTKQLAVAVNASNMAADTEHTVVCQHDGAGNLEMYLNAAAVGTGSGAGTGIPDTPAATLYWGSKDDGANQLEAAMLGALYNGRLSSSEITRYSSGAWPRRYRRQT